MLPAWDIRSISGRLSSAVNNLNKDAKIYSHGIFIITAHRLSDRSGRYNTIKQKQILTSIHREKKKKGKAWNTNKQTKTSETKKNLDSILL